MVSIQCPLVLNKCSVFHMKYQILHLYMAWHTIYVVVCHQYWVRKQISHPFLVKSSHSFHSVEARKRPVSFTFQQTHLDQVGYRIVTQGNVTNEHGHRGRQAKGFHGKVCKVGEDIKFPPENHKNLHGNGCGLFVRLMHQVTKTHLYHTLVVSYYTSSEREVPVRFVKHLHRSQLCIWSTQNGLTTLCES